VQRPHWAPPEVDIDRPASSRIYDYMLGGSHNFEADRAVAEQAIAAMPQLPSVLRENRRFLRRAVRYLAGEAGIDQFLDLGSGIPTVGNVHEIAGALNPAVRVVYVDIDPIAVAHAGAILVDDPGAAAVQADFRDIDAVLTDPIVGDVLALDRPVAVLLVAALHFLPDEDRPADILTHLRDRLAPGSYLALSHASADGRPPIGQRDAQEIYARSDNQITMRTAAEIAAFIEGWTPVPPGLVRCPAWRPDDTPDDQLTEFPGYSVVARLP
jgi:SAM-dependent methyltransferase